MDNQIYGAELDLKIDRFKAKANEARQTAQQLGKELGRGVTSYDLKNAGYYVKDFNNELKDTSSEMKKVNVASAKASVSVETGFSRGLKSLKRFALSLFGIRSMWALISRGASAYISQNEVLNKQIQLTSYTLGATLAPVIEKVINLAQYGVIIIAKLIQFFTGYNALAKVTTKNLNATSKAAKTLNKNLAGFDELTNLNPDTGGSLAGGIGADLKALNDFQDKIKEVDEWIAKFKKTGLGQVLSDVAGWIKDIDLKTALFVGGSGLALLKLLGGAGATGTSSILGTIGMIGLATGTTYAAVKKWADVLPGLKKRESEIDKHLENQKNNANLLAKATGTMVRSSQDKAKSEKEAKENLQMAYNTLKGQVETNYTLADQQRNQVDLLSGLLGLNKQYYGTAVNLVEENAKLLRAHYEQYDISKMDNEQKNQAIDLIQQSIDKAKELRKRFAEGGENYKAITKSINDSKDLLSEITGKPWKLSMKIEDNINSIKEKIKSLASGIGTLFQNLANPTWIKSMFASGVKNVASKVNSLFSSLGKINSFDVGTNYVPNDQMAMVHKGEAIVPKKYNPAIGGGANNNEDVVNAINVLNQTLINKNMNVSISRDDVGKASVEYINNKTRQLGESVIS